MNIGSKARRSVLGTLLGVMGAMSLGSVMAAPAKAPERVPEPAIIYLTRHAEKANGSDKDPDLTLQGQSRARHIATLLKTTGIKVIYSTATNRTRQTAQPLASQLKLEVQTYDPAQPGKLVEKIQLQGGTTLVVGHSNTVPELVKLLGGKPGPEIDDLEFDRLYQLIVAPDGTVTTVLFHSVAF